MKLQEIEDALGLGDPNWRQKIRSNLRGQPAVLFALRDIAEERRLLAAEVVRLRAGTSPPNQVLTR